MSILFAEPGLAKGYPRVLDVNRGADVEALLLRHWSLPKWTAGAGVLVRPTPLAPGRATWRPG